MSVITRSKTTKDLRREAIERELRITNSREAKILGQMEELVNQAQNESRDFKKFVQKSREKFKPSGKDDKTMKLADRLSKNVEVEGWDGVSERHGRYAKDQARLGGDIDKQMQAEAYRELEVECGHPECNKKVRASDEFCSKQHELNALADRRVRDINEPDELPNYPTFNDIKYGRAPMKKSQIQEQKARAKAKEKVLSGNEGK